jgi:hypothetical protein
MNQSISSTRNTLTLLSLALIFSLIVGFVNYNYISVKSTPLSYKTSILLYLPDKNQENTFILSNKSPKEWSTLAEVQSDTNAALSQSPEVKKQESFSVKYNPDLSAFLRNYFTTFAVMKRVSDDFGKKFDSNTAVASYNVLALGNGFVNLDINATNKGESSKFTTSITKEYYSLIADLNQVKPEGQKYPQLTPKISITENSPTQTKSIIQFLSPLLICLGILFYIILALRNKTLAK